MITDFVKQAYDMPQGGYPQYQMYPPQPTVPPAIQISYSNMPQRSYYNYRAPNRPDNFWFFNYLQQQAQQEAQAQAQQKPGMVGRALRAATGVSAAQEAQQNAQRVAQSVKAMLAQKNQPVAVQPAPVKTASLTIKEAAFLGTMGNLIGKGLRSAVPGMNMAYNAAKKFIQPYATKAMNTVQPYANKAINTVQPYAQQAMNRVTGFAKNGINDIRNGFNQGFAKPQVQGSLFA